MKQHSERRRFYWILGAIVVAAFALRLAVSWQLAAWNGGNNAVVNPSSLTDMRTYMELSTQVAAGTFTTEFDYQPFYYAVFLAAQKWLFGSSLWLVITVQALLGAATAGIAGLVGCRLGHREGNEKPAFAAGIAAALLTALSSTLVLYTPFHLLVTLQGFWLILLLWLTLRALDQPRWYWALAAGLVCGSAILTRGNVYFLAPGMLLALWVAGKSLRARLAYVLLALAAIAAVQLPFIWRNTAVKGTLTGASTASGKVLALGNTPEAPPGGRNPGLPAGPMEYPPVWHSWMATESEVSVPHRMWEWFCREPGAFIELNFRKALLFWDYREIPNNIGFHVDIPGLPIVGEADQAPLLRLAVVPTGVILALGIAGMLLALSRLRQPGAMAPAMAYYWVAAYWLGTTAFYILARFRAPLLPELAVFGGVAVQVFWDGRKNEIWRQRWLYWLLAVLAGTFVVFFANDWYRSQWEAAVMRQVRPQGVNEWMADGRQMVLDHGPQSFGAWSGFQLKRGMTIEKNFAGVPSEAGGILELSLEVARPGRLMLLANGRRELLDFTRPGFEVRTVELPEIRDGKVTLKVEQVTGEVFGVVDAQRDYGRTRIDGENAGSELVARLYLNKK